MFMSHLYVCKTSKKKKKKKKKSLFLSFFFFFFFFFLIDTGATIIRLYILDFDRFKNDSAFLPRRAGA